MKSGGFKKKIPVLFLIFVAGASVLNAQQGIIKGVLDWERMEFSADVILDLYNAGIKLPAGRTQAEALLEDRYPALIRSFIMELQADSSSLVEDMINWGGTVNTQGGESSPPDIFASLRQMPPVMSPDLASISGNYTLSLKGLASSMIRHTRPQTITGPLVPVPAGNYTGIIIVADENLPIHGRSTTALAQPCLFPKIWDSSMNLVYERNMIDPRAECDVSGLGRIKVRDWGITAYASRDKITKNTPSGLDEELARRVGNNPLRIMARGIFGAVPTDPIIDRNDALLVLSTEQNRRLLREGRVVIVLDKTVLKKNIP